RSAVRRVLRPAVGRVLPVLLAPVLREVDDGVDAQQPVHAALGRAVGPVDVVAVTEEHVEQEPTSGAAVRRERRTPRGVDRQGARTSPPPATTPGPVAPPA